jgi:hypothetical protein
MILVPRCRNRYLRRVFIPSAMLFVPRCRTLYLRRLNDCAAESDYRHIIREKLKLLYYKLIECGPTLQNTVE